MPAIILTLFSVLGKVLMQLGTSLLTEKVLKKAIIFALESVAKRTETDIDDKLLQIAKEQWEEKKED
jgi:hypothetical protein